MENFADHLARLAATDHIKRIDLFNAQRTLVCTIENQPGSQGSIKVYYHLYKQFGAISVAAAQAGLVIYAEHTIDAQHHPGKHPNIDRLFAVIANGLPLSVYVTDN
jgi:hypothetical protein